MSMLIDFWNWLPVIIQIVIKIVVIVMPLMLMVAYYTLLERKVIGLASGGRCSRLQMP